MSMMGLDALTSYANTQASQNDTSALESKLNTDFSDASDEELLSVCKDFVYDVFDNLSGLFHALDRNVLVRTVESVAARSEVRCGQTHE